MVPLHTLVRDFKGQVDVPLSRLEGASIPQLLMPLMGSEHVLNMLKFACTLCSGALLRQLCDGRGMGRYSPQAFYWYCASSASMGLSKHGTLSDRRFFDFQRACARGFSCHYGSVTLSAHLRGTPKCENENTVFVFGGWGGGAGDTEGPTRAVHRVHQGMCVWLHP